MKEYYVLEIYFNTFSGWDSEGVNLYLKFRSKEEAEIVGEEVKEKYKGYGTVATRVILESDFFHTHADVNRTLERYLELDEYETN